MEVNIERILHDVWNIDGGGGRGAIIRSFNLHPESELRSISKRHEDQVTTYFGVVFLRFVRGILPDEEIVRREET
jgi:hypothetical protein